MSDPHSENSQYAEQQLSASASASDLSSLITSSLIRTTPHISTPTPVAKVFRKCDYVTIQAGRKLNPVDFPFKDQAEISLHMEALASMNYDELNTVYESLDQAKAIFNDLDRSLIYLKNIGSEISRCSPNLLFSLESIWPYEVGPRVSSEKFKADFLELNHEFWTKQLKNGVGILSSSPDQDATPTLFQMSEEANLHEESFCNFKRRLKKYDENRQTSKHREPKVIDRAFFERHKSCTSVWAELLQTLTLIKIDYQHLRRDSYRSVGLLRQKLSALRVEENRCVSASEFAQSLAVLKAPFEFLRLPREICNQVFKKLLVFPYNTTLTELKQEHQGHNNQTRRRPLYLKLWTHPLFQTSTELRKQAKVEFCRCNTFASRSFTTLPADLGRRVSSFRGNIRVFTTTWTSLDSSSVRAAKALRAFKDLECLQIFVNLEQLSQSPNSTLGGLNAFLSLIKLPNPRLPKLRDVEVINIQLSRREQKTFEAALLNVRPDRLNSITRNKTTGSLGLRDFEIFQRICEQGKRMFFMRFEKSDSRLNEKMDSFDEFFSNRVLDSKNPQTIYCHGREPIKPSILWPKTSQKKAKQDTRKSRLHILIASKLELSVIEETLAGVRSTIISKRGTRVLLIAKEKDRLLAILKSDGDLWKTKTERLAFFKSLPFREWNSDSSGWVTGWDSGSEARELRW